MSERLREAAMDDAYAAGALDAENAATAAIWARFASRPSDHALRNQIINAVCEAIDAATSRTRKAAIAASLSPTNDRGERIVQ